MAMRVLLDNARARVAPSPSGACCIRPEKLILWYFFGIYSHLEIGIFRDEKIRDVITEPSRRSLTPSASAATHFSDLGVPGRAIPVSRTPLGMLHFKTNRWPVVDLSHNGPTS